MAKYLKAIIGIIAAIILVTIIGLLTGHTQALFKIGRDTISEKLSCYDLPFNAKAWIENRAVKDRCPDRLRMADDLIKSNKLINLEYEQLVELLGKPDKKKEEIVIYWLGPEQSYISVDSEWLYIRLDQFGKALKVEKHRD